MNHALCEIGIRYPQFTERCITLGETLGVYRDLKVSKGCTSAYAPNWIAAGKMVCQDQYRLGIIVWFSHPMIPYVLG